MGNNIERIVIAGYDENNEITAPAAVYLELFAISGTVTLRGRAGGETESSPAAEPLFDIDVPGRALLIALKAALKEDDDID